jgi:Family of unknown function (DUF5681)
MTEGREWAIKGIWSVRLSRPQMSRDYVVQTMGKAEIETPAKAVGKQQGKKLFQKGQSGNPAGRRKGTRNYATRLAEALFDGAAEEICGVVIDKAREGDIIAARLIVERLIPPRKDRPVSFPLPKIESAAEGPALTASLLDAVAAGEVTPSEAIEVASLVEKHVRVLEAADFDTRLKALEEREGIGNGR